MEDGGESRLVPRLRSGGCGPCRGRCLGHTIPRLRHRVTRRRAGMHADAGASRYLPAALLLPSRGRPAPPAASCVTLTARPRPSWRRTCLPAPPTGSGAIVTATAMLEVHRPSHPTRRELRHPDGPTTALLEVHLPSRAARRERRHRDGHGHALPGDAPAVPRRPAATGATVTATATGDAPARPSRPAATGATVTAPATAILEMHAVPPRPPEAALRNGPGHDNPGDAPAVPPHRSERHHRDDPQPGPSWRRTRRPAPPAAHCAIVTGPATATPGDAPAVPPHPQRAAPP